MSASAPANATLFSNASDASATDPGPVAPPPAKAADPLSFAHTPRRESAVAPTLTEAVLAAIAGEGAVVAAVSGGSDSLALLVLTQDILARHAPRTRLHAVTVDHALREGSAAEAERVAALCAALGVSHRTLRWTGPKPATGLMAAARLARYRLLSAAAAGAGARVVLTGHTADDQAETVAMRAARGPGRGLSGMASMTLFERRTWIARPLLGERRAVLREALHQRGLSWIEDPTNTDPRFERARARGAALDTAALLDRAARAARERIAQAHAAAACLRAYARAPAPGLLAFDAALLDAPDRAGAVLALRLLLAVAGARAHLVDEPRAVSLFAALRRPGRHALSGALVARHKATVFLHRERRRSLDIAPAEANDTATDSPFCASDPLSPVPAFVFRSLAAAGAQNPDDSVSTPFDTFLPLFDRPAAEALAGLLGHPPFPDVPGAGL